MVQNKIPETSSSAYYVPSTGQDVGNQHLKEQKF